MNRIEVVGAVVVHDGAVLACRRAPGRPTAGAWEFPGGKVGPGESPRAALAREILEELGVTVRVEELIDRTVTVVGDLEVDLACYRCTVTGRHPTTSTDHDRLAWVPPADLDGLAWSPPDLPTVRLLAHGGGAATVGGPTLLGPASPDSSA